MKKQMLKYEYIGMTKLCDFLELSNNKNMDFENASVYTK